MAIFGKVYHDTLGLVRVIGPYKAVKWLWGILLNFRTIFEQRSLSSADRWMGSGAFVVNYSGRAKFRTGGPEAFAGIREMYARDVYLKKGVLTVEDGDFVIDLGSNMGNFTNLALAHGPAVSVLAVEPNSATSKVWERSVGLNPGHGERARLIKAFVGLMGDKQHDMRLRQEYQDAQYLTENELIDLAAIQRVDFLKCDIEGGEFSLLGPNSRLLAMANKIAIEVHSFAGDVPKFIQMLRDQGFVLGHIQHDPDGTCTVLGRRAQLQQPPV